WPPPGFLSYGKASHRESSTLCTVNGTAGFACSAREMDLAPGWTGESMTDGADRIRPWFIHPHLRFARPSCGSRFFRGCSPGMSSIGEYDPGPCRSPVGCGSVS